MEIQNDQITSFMLAIGLTQDQASQIHERARSHNTYAEDVLSALYPANVFLPDATEYSRLINNHLCV